MTDLPAKKQADKAIVHTLRNISERPGVAWYLGHGTQTYSLLIEAYATLHQVTLEKACQHWPPAAQPKFEGEECNTCPFCGSHAMELQTEDDVHHIECLDCHATGPRTEEFYHDSPEETKAEARARWNERKMPR
jgi:Lar family restriction alleviation protein